MKKIVCEMCGSSDFAKVDGMFVCQTCGMKYSIDEAKALMVDDGNDVPATEPQAQSNEPSKLEKLRILAKRASEENNTESAEKYYNEILLEDPNDWEANFYATYYAVHNIKIAQIGSAAIKLANSFPSVIALMVKSVPEEKISEVCNKLYCDVSDFASMLMNNASSHLSSDFGRAQEQTVEWVVPIMRMQMSFANSVFNNTECYELLDIAYKNIADGCNSLVNSTKISAFVTLSKEAKSNLEKVKSAKLIRQAKLITKYWEEHPEEKAALDNEKKDLQDQLANKEAELKEIEEQIVNIPEKLQVKENLNKVEELKKQKAGLGLFKGKEKEAIQVQIDELNGKNARELFPIISEKEAPLNEKKAAISKEIEEINNNIDKINKKIARID